MTPTPFRPGSPERSGRTLVATPQDRMRGSSIREWFEGLGSPSLERTASHGAKKGSYASSQRPVEMQTNSMAPSQVVRAAAGPSWYWSEVLSHDDAVNVYEEARTQGSVDARAPRAQTQTRMQDEMRERSRAESLMDESGGGGGGDGWL